MSLRSPADIASKWLGLLLGALIILGTIVFGCAFVNEERTPPHGYIEPICATHFDFPTYWPCSDLHRIQGERCVIAVPKGKKKPERRCFWVSPDYDVMEKSI